MTPLGIDSLAFPTCNAVPQPAAPQRTLFMNKYIIGIDVKLCLSSAVNDIVQTDKDIVMYLVPFPFHGCTQYDVRCHFAGDSENHAVSILNHNTVSFNGSSKNGSNTTDLYDDPGGRAVEVVCLWTVASCDCGSVACECCVLSDRGLCDVPIHRPENCYRVCVCLFVSLSVIRCNLKTLHLQWLGKKGPTRK